MRHLRRSTAVFSTFVLGACGAGDATSEMSMSAQSMTAALNAAVINYRVEVGQQTWTKTLAPLASMARPGRRAAEVIRTPPSGTARVSFTVVLPDGQTAASGEQVIALRGNWAWDFDLVMSADDPELLCFGCFDTASFPLDPALQLSDRDAIWLVWSGRTIDKPIVRPNR